MDVVYSGATFPNGEGSADGKSETEGKTGETK